MGRWFERSLAQFGRDVRGNVAMMWALMATGLIGAVGLTVDYTHAQTIRTQLQNAADGAALVAARNAATVSLADRTTMARAYFNAEAGQYGQTATFSLTPVDDDTYKINAQISMPGSLTKLISQQDWKIGVESQAVHGGTNIEVALVLDTTGSMAGTKISDLRSAATDFVNIVVNDVQTPFYSKVALIPFSAGVNVGSTYSGAAHGPIAGTSGKPITGAAWFNGSAQTISAATKASPAVFTANNHGLANNDIVWLTGISGSGSWPTQLNNKWYTVVYVNANSFQLKNSSGTLVNSSGYGNYPGSGSVTKCLVAACQIQMTSNGHGFANNDWVFLTGVGGMTAKSGFSPLAINNTTGSGSAATAWQLTSVATNTFVLAGSVGPQYNNYTANTGTAYCTALGCPYQRFANANSGVNVWPISANCVTDRAGGHANDAVGPATALLGYNYYAPSDNNSRCPTTSIVPLTSNKTTLNSAISTLAASGYTAGQIGTAWGWYMISPDWNAVWTGSSAPAAYHAPQSAKVAVIMTDGTYNLMYCNGAISKDAASGTSTTRANCNAPNGDGGAQALALCNAMKAQGIIVYTVGFDMAGEPASSKQMLQACATNPTSPYFNDAADGAALRQVFRSIATSISQLRISR